MQTQDFEVQQLPPGSHHCLYLEIATLAHNLARGLPLQYVTGGRPGPVLVVLAGIHGDEYEGIAAVPQIFQRVTPAELSGTLLLVPVCNPPAFAATARTGALDGLDMARVFPGLADGSPTQQLAYWITDKLIRPADFLIDLHSAGLKYRIPPLVGYLDTGDAMGQRSRAGAQAFGGPVLWRHPPPIAPGRSLSAGAALGISSLYAEARGGGQVRRQDIEWLIEGVLNVMRQLQMLPGEPQSRPFDHCLVGDGNLDVLIRAQTEGYFRADVELMEQVAPGQRVGAIYDPFGALQELVVADQAGTVVLLRQVPRVGIGEGLVSLTGAALAD
jgi:predicted deacylase